MADVVNCNKEQAEKILEIYFAKEPIVKRVSKDDEDDIYFITAETSFEHLRTECQYRGRKMGACFVQIRKGERRYDLSYGYPEELMKPLNDACRRAVENYEKGNDLFLKVETKEVGTKEVEAVGEDIKRVIKSSDRKVYMLCFLLLILFLIWLFM